MPNNIIEEQNKKMENWVYPPEEDIYEQGQPISLDAEIEGEQKRVSKEILDMDLDVPGAELDNEMEKIGGEDEENNYFSTSQNRDPNQ